MHSRIALLVALCALPLAANAHDYQLNALRIDHPFARATPPGARTGGAFFVLENRGPGADRLVSATSPVSGSVELHEMVLDAGVMKMHLIPGLELKPGARVELKPGGYHLMLLDLKQALKEGDRIPLTLTFEQAGKIDVSVWVEAMGASGAATHDH